MKEYVSYAEWTCDDCGAETVTQSWVYPEGWDEVDDNPEGKCKDICPDCLKNHSIT